MFQDNFNCGKKLLLFGERKEELNELVKILEADYEVFFVNGEKGIDDPLAILIDMDREDLSAKMLLLKIREDPRYEGVPLILLSSDPGIEVVCHYLGGDEVLLKPFDDRKLILARVKRTILSKQMSEVKERRAYHKDPLSLNLLKDFDGALRNDELEVWYQPKYNIRGNVPILSSAEALVRWRHPKYGLLYPDAFIPLLEEKGRIYDLDTYVWAKAALQIRKWKEELKISVPISVNVSRQDLKEDLSMNYLETLIRETKISHDELLLEITESVFEKDADLIRRRINILRNLGFLIEMDDFGTGYSSLSMAEDLPIDVLKIDMRFVKDAFDRKKDTGMIEIILKLAAYLKVLTVAEGVEDLEQLNTLKEMGCDIVQGYYFSKPVPEKEFRKFLEEKLTIFS